MNKRLLLPALLVAGPVAALIFELGCGILTAPVSVPMAIADNANFSLDLDVVDPQGHPLDAVLLSQQLNHEFWNPISISSETDEHKTRRFDQHVQVNERGARLYLSFTRDGYLDAACHFFASDAATIMTDQGNWHYTKHFPVVMVPRDKQDAPLRVFVATIDYADFPNQRTVFLSDLWQPGTQLMKPPLVGPDSNGLRWSPGGATNTAMPNSQRVLPVSNMSVDVTDPSSFAAGTFYVTLTRQPPQPINAHGDIDPADVNLPDELTLHVAGADCGFISIQPRVGFAPIYLCDEAPTTGYEPQLTIPRQRLKDMRGAAQGLVIDAHEYFYIKAAGHYGKGYVAWSSQRIGNSTEFTPLQFRLGFWMQPEPAATDLTYHRGYVAGDAIFGHSSPIK